ncbi:MAG: hypothetical protein ACK45X_11920, partial [Roseiflexaceae bacterium]
DIAVRVDFDANTGANVFGNRARFPAKIRCTSCPNIVDDTTVQSRIAQFNMGSTKNQMLAISNINTLFQNTLSVVMLVNITQKGTVLAVGPSNMPRLRLQVEALGQQFVLKATRGTVILRNSKNLLNANTWYTVIYSESNSLMSLSYGTSADALTTITQPISPLTMVADTAYVGAIASTTDATTFEDYFAGSINDIIVLDSLVRGSDLRTLTASSTVTGSGVQTHAVRFQTQNVPILQSDTLAPKLRAFYPINQVDYPLINVANGHRSHTCADGSSQAMWTCPELRDGFTSRGIALLKASDGVN